MKSESAKKKQVTPFHEDEVRIQKTTGKDEWAAEYGPRAILPYLIEQHRDFYAQLPFMVVGSVDEDGDLWATLLCGEAGFAHSPEPEELRIDVIPNVSDPLASAIQLHEPLGLLGIQPSTRRRNRVNANIRQIDDAGFSLEVAHAYGNCPKFIQTRELAFVREIVPHDMPLEKTTYTELDEVQRDNIREADTFFVSSASLNTDNPEADGVDVSHRGGLPGFVSVEGNTLTVPDYSGNYLFNTLGNFLHTPKAGLVFPDFETGDLMMLTGTVEVLWEDHPFVMVSESAERAWRFTLSHGMTLKAALPFEAPLNEYSPFSITAAE